MMSLFLSFVNFSISWTTSSWQDFPFPNDVLIVARLLALVSLAVLELQITSHNHVQCARRKLEPGNANSSTLQEYLTGPISWHLHDMDIIRGIRLPNRRTKGDIHISDGTRSYNWSLRHFRMVSSQPDQDLPHPHDVLAHHWHHKPSVHP